MKSRGSLTGSYLFDTIRRGETDELSANFFPLSRYRYGLCVIIERVIANAESRHSCLTAGITLKARRSQVTYGYMLPMRKLCGQIYHEL